MSDKLNNLNILIVDDSSTSRMILKNILSEIKPNSIFEASDASEALKSLKTNQIQIVITDIVMPNISGLELTKTISQTLSHIPVIVISSLTQEHIILEAINSGASDFLSKPIQRENLIHSIQKVMDHD